MCHAFLLGLSNTVEESFTFGLIIPMLNCTLTTVSVFGLLEVGSTMLDPFGGDPEDYAIVHFVEHVAFATQEVILADRPWQPRGSPAPPATKPPPAAKPPPNLSASPRPCTGAAALQRDAPAASAVAAPAPSEHALPEHAKRMAAALDARKKLMARSISPPLNCSPRPSPAAALPTRSTSLGTNATLSRDVSASSSLDDVDRELERRDEAPRKASMRGSTAGHDGAAGGQWRPDRRGATRSPDRRAASNGHGAREHPGRSSSACRRSSNARGFV
jgi:hypothetical protein